MRCWLLLRRCPEGARGPDHLFCSRSALTPSALSSGKGREESCLGALVFLFLACLVLQRKGSTARRTEAERRIPSRVLATLACLLSAQRLRSLERALSAGPAKKAVTKSPRHKTEKALRSPPLDPGRQPRPGCSPDGRWQVAPQQREVWDACRAGHHRGSDAGSSWPRRIPFVPFVPSATKVSFKVGLA